MSTYLDDLRGSWLRHLRARNLSVKTQGIYGNAAQLFIDFTGDIDPQSIDRALLEKFLVDYGTDHAPATVSNVYRALQQWMHWLAAEGEVPVDPTLGMKPPMVPESLVEVLTDDQLKALLADCAGTDLVARRDTALMRLLIDTGGRISEITGLQTTDLDLDAMTAKVLGKGRRERYLPFGAKTSEALDRYLRLRRQNRYGRATTDLWIGKQGAMTGSGLYQIVKRHGEAVGIPDIHPHKFRHTSSHRWLAAGGSETDLMSINGWQSRSMVSRYAASAAAERARDAHRRLGLGDQL